MVLVTLMESSALRASYCFGWTLALTGIKQQADGASSGGDAGGGERCGDGSAGPGPGQRGRRQRRQ